jgi:glycosyl transferase family 25
MNNISDVKHAFYINLSSRKDRKEYIEKEVKKIGLQIERFNAIKLPNGALGCSMSHLKLLETAKKNNWEYILIVEDDIQFLNPELFVNQFNAFLSRNKSFDVVLLAGNNMPPYTIIDDTCVKVKSCQTTTGYLVQNHYFDTLIQNYRDGIGKLLKYPEQHTLYAIDKYWFKLQEKDNWFLIIPLSVTQREDYSNIEMRPTNYTPVMLDLDKKAHLQKQLKQQSYPKMKLLNPFN